jgi:23S rRNA pseudouridine1911/1915/1917 synthase
MSQIKKTFGTDMYEVVYPVSLEEDGLRLDQFLSRYFESFSRQNIKKKIVSGDVKISNRPYPHKPSVKVYNGENIKIITKKANLEDEYWNGEKLELQEPTVIFEDDDIMVINKPPYMATHPTGKHLFNCATVYYGNILKQKMHSIHRLDRETSGCLILGKNPSATQDVTSLFELNKVKKCYFLIAHKKMMNEFPFTADENLGQKDDYIPRLFVHCFEKNSEDGKVAETKFELIQDLGEYIIVLAFPKTGRQHQIRSHAAHHGFPLLGDKLYNGDPNVFRRFKDLIATKDDHELMQISRHALHAVGISFPYKGIGPVTAPIPNDLSDWLTENFGVDSHSLDLKIKEIIKREL